MLPEAKVFSENQIDYWLGKVKGEVGGIKSTTSFDLEDFDDDKAVVDTADSHDTTWYIWLLVIG